MSEEIKFRSPSQSKPPGRLLHHLSPKPNEKYLDLGCGSGNYTLVLKNAGLTLTGAAISKEMLNRAYQKDLTIDWVFANVESLPFGDNVFSGATCVLAIQIRQGSSTFSSLADPNEVEKGCTKLDGDIRSGRIQQVITSYVKRGEGTKINYWNVRFHPLKYFKQYRELTIKQNGKSGSLFYAWIVTISLFAVCIISLIVTVLINKFGW